MSRYSNRPKRLNNPLSGGPESIYTEFIENRNVRHIEQYTTPEFSPLTAARRASIPYDSHVWTTGDRFYKLAHDYYGNSALWWIIAWFNQTPTEHHLNL